jgi:AraC-like DNA-binding protein
MVVDREEDVEQLPGRMPDEWGDSLMSDDVAWHRAKLTLKQVREIRRMLEYEPISYAALARRFGLSEPTISQIANYQTWREPVTPPVIEHRPTRGGDPDADTNKEAIRNLGQ